jgi:hypothetical protein
MIRSANRHIRFQRTSGWLIAAIVLTGLSPRADAQLHHFAVGAEGGGPVGPGTALTPFPIQVIAQDSTNSTVTDFSGTVVISSNGPLLTGGGTTASFTGGILSSHSVNFNSGGSFTLVATNSAGAESGASDTFIVSNPLPQISSISPSSRTAGDTSFTITVTGAGLTPATAVRLDGSPRPTSYLSDTVLTATIAAGDIASAGTFGIDVASPEPGGGVSTQIPFTVLEPVLNARIILEGPYSGGTMATQLRAAGFIPKAQPFNAAPWNYAGTENVAAVPAGVVDWILLSLRTGTTEATRVSSRAAFLKSDASVTDLDGSSPVSFPGVGLGNYYVVIRHRNHIPAMTATPRPLNAPADSCDLTTSPAKFFGGQAKSLTGGKYGLYAGDDSGDRFIDAADFAGPDNDIFLDGYRTSDLNLDGFIDAADFSSPDNNIFTGSNVPE